MLHRDVKYIEADNQTFEMGYNPQTEWKWLITLAFFCGELGAGVFLVSLFVPAAAAKLAFFAGLLGWLIVAGPKNLFHFIYLGKPWRFWRGLSRPGQSWITRGFYATFSLCGLIHPEFSQPNRPNEASHPCQWFLLLLPDFCNNLSSGCIHGSKSRHVHQPGILLRYQD